MSFLNIFIVETCKNSMGNDNKVTLDKKNEEVHIEKLTISNPDTYNFLKDKENLTDWTTKALIIGCIGLK